MSRKSNRFGVYVSDQTIVGMLVHFYTSRSHIYEVMYFVNVACSPRRPTLSQRHAVLARVLAMMRYDTRCYFNVRSKADISQLNLLCVRLSVCICQKSVFYRTADRIERVFFCMEAFFRSVLICVIRKFRYLQNKGTSLWHFVPKLRT